MIQKNKAETTRSSMGHPERAIDLDGTTILITGAAGFIGAHLAVRLLGCTEGSRIVGLDNMNDYYDPALKQARLDWIGQTAVDAPSTWEFEKLDIADKDTLFALFDKLPMCQEVLDIRVTEGWMPFIDHVDLLWQHIYDSYVVVLC